MDFNDIVFKRLSSFFNDLGFVKHDFLNQFGLMRFYKSQGNLEYVIGLSFGLATISFNGLHYKIIINDVNEILNNFIDLEKNIEYYTVQDYIDKSIWSSEIDKLGNILIESKSNLKMFESNVFEYLNKFSFPFFSKYPDITAINEKILNKVPQKDYPEWFHGKSTLKILIIMKLCNNPKYNFYKASKEKEYLAFVNQNPAMWKPAYDTFCSLLEYLDKGHYNKTAIK